MATPLMNYDGPRQIQDGPSAGKWRYTSQNRRSGTHPIGYCSPWRTCPECQGHGIATGCTHCEGKGAIQVEQCPGHDTEHEACVHYTEYLLTEKLRLDGKVSGQQLPCQVCKAWTQGMASVGEWRTFMLCDEHRTRETVAELLGTIGSSMHS